MLHADILSTAQYIRAYVPNVVIQAGGWNLDVLVVQTADDHAEIEISYDGELTATLFYNSGGSHEGDWDEELGTGFPYEVGALVAEKLRDISAAVSEPEDFLSESYDDPDNF